MFYYYFRSLLLYFHYIIFINICCLLLLLSLVLLLSFFIIIIVVVLFSHFWTCLVQFGSTPILHNPIPLTLFPSAQDYQTQIPSAPGRLGPNSFDYGLLGPRTYLCLIQQSETQRPPQP